jgi:hypothetical protein
MEDEMETTELETQALTALDQAKTMPPVTSAADYQRVGEFIVSCKQLIAKINGAHAESIEAAHRSHKAAIALRDSHIQPINQALAVVQPLAMAYKKQQDVAAALERARIAKEQQEEREAQALKDAEYLAEFGDNEAAEEVLVKATTPAPVRITPVASTLPKVAGLTSRKSWKCRIISPQSVNRAYLEPNTKLINIKVDGAFYKISTVTPAMIKALEDEIGGIEIYQDEIFAGRQVK